MARVICEAIKKEDGVKRRGQATIEWYDKNNKPQYYCRGHKDASTEEYLGTCKKCRDFIDGVDCKNDFEQYKKRNKIT